jgi:hypothetical protein
MRRGIMVGLLCVACTRDNPAFDERLTMADAGTDDDGDTGDGDTSDGDGDGDASTTGNDIDLPSSQPACEFQPTEGLSIHVGGPEDFGGQCPTGVDMGMKVVSAGGGQVIVEACAHGCMPCYGTHHTISAFPLLLDGHIPTDAEKCMSLEAGGPLGGEPGACHFGALTIYDQLEQQVPYVIATAHSYEPTPIGATMLGAPIPAPLKAASCNCDDIGQSNDCCYMAMSPPEFWYYPLDGATLFPGDDAVLDVPNQAGLVHAFKVFQAQLLHSCENPDLQLSWAVVAVL